MKSFSDLFLNIRVRTGQRRKIVFISIFFPLFYLCVSDYEGLIVAKESDINPCRWSLVIVMTFCKHQLVPAVSVSLMRLGLMLVR